MKTVFILFLAFFAIDLSGQDIPESVIKSMDRNVGVWLADNSAYQTENELFDQYGIEWEYGVNKVFLKGELFGLINGERQAVFWKFLQYWDGEAKKLVVLQIGTSGVVGSGYIDNHNMAQNELKQKFIQPNGETYNMGHKTTIHSASSHTDVSYQINENGEWIEQRTYTWNKQK